jgi:signal transduction histidine kinase
MGDRKLEQSSSPGGSASLRISTGGKTRPSEVSDNRSPPTEKFAPATAPLGTAADAEAGKPLDSSELLRSNAMLFLVSAVFTTAFAVTELATGHFREIGASYLWLVIAGVLSWTAFFLRERGQHWLWTSLIGVALLNTLLITSDMPSAIVLAGVLVILMWSGFILRPRYNVLLAVYAVLMMWRMGGEFVMSVSQMDDPTVASGERDEGRRFALPVLFTFIAVPIGLGTILHLRQRSSPRSVDAGAVSATLAAENEDLKRRLEGKSNELQLASEQLFEAQKLKMVGTMAAGLAHELNNILTPIRGHAELIAEGEHKVEQIRRYGQRILDSAVAAAQITQALLTYAHKDTFQPVRSNLRQLLQSTILPVLSKTLPNQVHLKTDLARNVSVDVDRHLFQQAIVNLVFNACDAMPEGGEIVIGLTTSTAPAGERTEGGGGEESHGGEAVDRSAVVTVADNGTGIEEEHLSQIFDPFFTTKAVGSGSGLGLAMVMGTVTRHHGRIEVDSVLNQGTTFRIYLPLAVSDEKNDGPKPWPVLRGDAKGPVVIVVTEDQDALDEFEELLEAVECAPICTNDAKAAAPLLTEMGDKVDLLILDLELRATDGKRLFKTVRELFPEMPVILLSDQPTDPMVQRMMAAGPTRSVRKPMDNRLFSALLTDLLNPADGYVRDFTPVPINPSADVSGPHPRAG